MFGSWLPAAEDVNSLNGKSFQSGFTAGALPCVGVDAIKLSTSHNVVDGIQVFDGVGFGIDAHVQQTYTIPYKTKNLFYTKKTIASKANSHINNAQGRTSGGGGRFRALSW